MFSEISFHKSQIEKGLFQVKHWTFLLDVGSEQFPLDGIQLESDPSCSTQFSNLSVGGFEGTWRTIRKKVTIGLSEQCIWFH